MRALRGVLRRREMEASVGLPPCFCGREDVVVELSESRLEPGGLAQAVPDGSLGLAGSRVEALEGDVRIDGEGVGEVGEDVGHHWG